MTICAVSAPGEKEFDGGVEGSWRVAMAKSILDAEVITAVSRARAAAAQNTTKVVSVGGVIADFVGRNSTDTDSYGIDAALDFPLFFKLPDVAKSFADVAALRTLFDERRKREKELLSTHGDAGKYFVRCNASSFAGQGASAAEELQPSPAGGSRCTRSLSLRVR